jgi:hypothetical protein
VWNGDVAAGLLFGPMTFRLLVGHTPIDAEAAALLAGAALQRLLTNPCPDMSAGHRGEPRRRARAHRPDDVR